MLDTYLLTNYLAAIYDNETDFIYNFFHNTYGYGDSINEDDAPDCRNQNGGINYEAYGCKYLSDIFSILNDKSLNQIYIFKTIETQPEL